MNQINIHEITNSKVLVKVGFDLPSLQDYSRILDAKKTIDLLLQNQNKIILVSHWGRPKSFEDTDFSLQKMQDLISKLLGKNVEFINQYQDFNLTLEKINQSKSQIILLENTRFDPAEQSKDAASRESLAKKYASFGAYFVDEAFSLSHRKEATNTELKNFLPWCFGLSFTNEIQHLDLIKNNPKKPFVVIMAGSKLETKLPIITKMLPICDKLLIAGKLCFTFLEAARELALDNYGQVDFGKSQIEKDFLPTAKELLLKYKDKIVLPTDFVFGDKTANLILDLNLEDKYALDIGPVTIANFQLELIKAATVFWNGTIGYYEKPIFNKGNIEIAKFLADNKSINKILGGGDTASSLDPEILSKINFVSMGGGASLSYLSS